MLCLYLIHPQLLSSLGLSNTNIDKNEKVIQLLNIDPVLLRPNVKLFTREFARLLKYKGDREIPYFNLY